MGNGYWYCPIRHFFQNIKCKLLSYQAGEPDQFHHRYWYDADNRITHVETSDDNINWQQDAKYFYYKHGPLARVELGNDKVQALDYAYTLQGWLKGVNSDALDPSLDIGKDGYVASANLNQFIGDDQFGFSLGYYQGDYTPVGGTNAQFVASITGPVTNLFNGNISSMLSSSRHVNDQISVISLGFKYQYDQLNRLRHMATFENLTANNWSITADSTASSSYIYDKNGNLLYLKRYNRSSELFDDFTYQLPNNSNRLRFVDDVASVNLESTDIDGLAGTYFYDEIGNLISDESEGIDLISWTASGKVKSVTRLTGLNDPDLHFKYDPTGNRIVKMVEDINFFDQSLAYYTKTYYLRDAQGNIMATYNRTYAGESLEDLTMSFSLVERSVYGSSRIANYVDSVQLVSLDETVSEDFVYYDSPDILSHTNGFKHFELTNHLGNVMAVVSDKRTPIITGSEITGYTPELLIAKDYYPFGMEMSGRYTGVGNEDPMNEYRFGFNGKEKDDEWNGQTGTTYDFGARLYDARIGRWMAIDPLAGKYPDLSPYCFVGNMPIIAFDPNGKEIVIAHLSETQQNQYNAQISKLRAENVYFDVMYSMLESSEIKYYITEGQRTNFQGSFRAGINNTGEEVSTGGNVDFRTFNFDDETAIEEFFHAFQNETYVDKGGFDKLYNVGSNVEFEAKFLQLMIDINKGGVITSFPDVEALNEVAFDLTEKYNLSDEQKQKYFNALNTFIDYHKNQKDIIEQETGTRPKDMYDAPATDQTPDAAFKILEAGDKKKNENE